MILLCGLVVFAMFAMLMADAPAGGGGSDSADSGGDSSAQGDSDGGDSEGASSDADGVFGPPDDTIFDDETTDETGEDPPAEGEVRTEAPATFTNEHFEIAKHFGLSEEDVKAFGSPEKFATAMHKVLDARDSMVRAQLGGQGKTPEQQQLPPGASGDDIPLFELKFENKEMLDPELVANVEGINKHYHGLFNQVRDAMRTMQAQIGPLRELQFASDFDEALSGLPEEYSGILGKGSYRSMDRSSAEFGARQKVISKMQEMAEGMTVRGSQLPPLPELCAQAVQALYAGKATENQNTKARQELNGKLRSRASQIIGRPTQRSNRELPFGDERATRAVRQFLRDKGETAVSESELGI